MGAFLHHVESPEQQNQQDAHIPEQPDTLEVVAVAPLLPRARRKVPSSFIYVTSIQPLVSSPSNLKGTGYGTLNGSALQACHALVSLLQHRRQGCGQEHGLNAAPHLMSKAAWSN